MAEFSNGPGRPDRQALGSRPRRPQGPTGLGRPGRPPGPWILSTAALLLALLAAEAGLRLLGFGRPPLLIEDRRMEYRFRPDQTLTRFGHRIAINRWGMRSPPLTPQPAPGRRRLLVLGDSIVWGGAETDQDAIAVSRLQRRLGSSWEVANLATPSWGPANWLGAVQSFGLLGARQVLLVISSHDAMDDPSYAPLEASPETPSRNPPLALLELWQRYLAPRLSRALPEPLRGAIPGPGTPAAASDPSGPQSQERPQSPSPPQATAGPGIRAGASTRRPPELLPPLPSLEALVSTVQARGVPLVVLQFWERGELEAGRPWPDHDRITALLQRRGVPITQAGPILLRCAAAHGQPVSALYVDHIHPYTDLGQRCLAEALAEALRPAANTPR